LEGGKFMINNEVKAQKYLGKEVITLKDGTYLGKVHSIVINAEEKRIIGITIKLKGLLSGKMFIPLDSIQGFGTHGITIKEEFEPGNSKVVEEKEILDMPVITTNGTLLGKIYDFGFDVETGQITQYILTEGLVKDTYRGKALIEASDVFRIGKDVVIVNSELEQLDMMDYYEEEPDETEINPQWEIQEDKELSQEDHDDPEKYWEQTLSDAKKIAETWKATLKEQGSKLGAEAKEIKNTSQQMLETFLDDAQKKIQEQLEKLNQVKEVWEEKLNNIKSKPQEELGEQVLMEIKGKTIGKPLCDDQGEVIILPGQVIDDKLIKKAIENGKLHELFILIATKDVEDEIEKVDIVEI